MTASRQRTLGELRHSLAVRLGFGASGSKNKFMIDILDDFLQDSQRQLANEYTRVFMNKIIDDDKQIFSGESLYDIPDNCDPNHLDFVGMSESNGYYELCEGIDKRRSSQDTSGRPTRYEIRYGTSDQAQIELWPTPSQSGQLRLEYLQRLKPFSKPADEATIDDTAIFLLALSLAKAHYRQPDAGALANQLQTHIRRLKFKQHGNRKYSFLNNTEQEIISDGYAEADQRKPPQLSQSSLTSNDDDYVWSTNEW